MEAQTDVNVPRITESPLVAFRVSPVHFHKINYQPQKHFTDETVFINWFFVFSLGNFCPHLMEHGRN